MGSLFTVLLLHRFTISLIIPQVHFFIFSRLSFLFFFLYLIVQLNQIIMLRLNDISGEIIGCAIEVHRTLGPGLLESAYERALIYELNLTGMKVLSQVEVPFVYKGTFQNIGYRIDLLVEDSVIIEIKSVDKLAPVHFAQTLTYLKLANKRLGLLINFNSDLLKNGVKRVVNNLIE